MALTLKQIAEAIRNLDRMDAERVRDLVGFELIEDIFGQFEEPGRKITEEEIDTLNDYDKQCVEIETLRKQVRALSGSESAIAVVGATITLRSGKVFDYVEPTPEMFDLEDIAWGLAKEGRYANQLPGALEYSVCQHSCMVHDQAPPAFKKEALFHDAPEFVVKDIPKPLKIIIGPGYAAVEDRVAIAIAKKFDLPLKLPKIIKVLDWRALNTERKFLSIDRRGDWQGLNEYKPFENVTAGDMCPWTVEHAAEQFLKRARALGC